MRIPIKSPSEIAKMQRAGEVAASILLDVARFVQAGMTTAEIDAYTQSLFKLAKCQNAFHNYHGYPGHLCISVNEEVVHGIGGRRVIEDGDIVSLDVGTIVDGWFGDNALTVPVGNVSPKTMALLTATEASLHHAIQLAREGTPLADLCDSVHQYIKKHGFTIVRDFVGHGIGRALHEEPQIPNYRPNYKTPRLQAGMALAIEPMVNLGKHTVKVLADGWTVVTTDGTPSAHFEHTVIVTKGEPLIITPRPLLSDLLKL